MTENIREPGAAPPRSGRRGRGGDLLELGLRKLWSAMEHEPVPASFLDLLDEIDAHLARLDDGAAAPPASPTPDKTPRR